MVDAGQWLANTGEWLGAPELNWSEKLKGTTIQTQPTTQVNPLSSAAGLTGGYFRSPVPGNYDVSTQQFVQNPTSLPKVDPVWQQQQLLQQTSPPPPPPPQNNDVRSNGGSQPNVGDISADGNYRWNGNGWEQRYPSNGGYSSYSDYEAKQNAYREQQTGLINSQFDSYFSDLDRRIGGLPQEQQSNESQVGNLFNSTQGTINTERDRSTGQLDSAGQRVTGNKLSTLRDLESNLRNAFLAGNTYLGGIGAGSSSAGGMLSFALTKQANRERAGVQKQSNQQYADIDLRKNEVINTASNEVNKLTEWKNNEMLKVGDYIRQKKDQLQSLVSQGQMDKAQALQALNTEVFGMAQQRLAQLDQQVVSWNQGIQQWALSRTAQLDDYKIASGKLSNYNPTDLVRQELSGLPQNGSGQRAMVSSPYGVRGKEEKNNLFG